MTDLDKICYIPDVHNKIEVAQSILDKEESSVKKFVFLGDYLHSFGDSPHQIASTGKWVRTVQDRGDCVTLMGNHDASHLHPYARCSGWSSMKHVIFESWVGNSEFMDISRLEPSFAYGDVLATHAGYYGGAPLSSYENAVRDMRDKGLYDEELLDAHVRNGGSADPAGILWGRPCFNNPILPPGIYLQIFGHTVHQEPTYGPDRDWLCLDTNLSHYAIISFDQDKFGSISMASMEIKKV